MTVADAVTKLAEEMRQLASIGVDDYMPTPLAITVGRQAGRVERAAWDLAAAIAQEVRAEVAPPETDAAGCLVVKEELCPHCGLTAELVTVPSLEGFVPIWQHRKPEGGRTAPCPPWIVYRGSNEEMSYDEAEDAGLDGTGRDGHPDFPHRRPR